MEKNSLQKKQVDWSALRRETLARASGAEQPMDTYDAIRFALGLSTNNHGFLQLSPELIQQEAARHKAASKAPITLTRQPSPYSSRREADVVLQKTGNCTVPLVIMPLYTSQQGDAFAIGLQRRLREANAKRPCG